MLHTTGTLHAAAGAQYAFTCNFGTAVYATLHVDDHLVCQHGAYNRTGAAEDPGQFRLRSKQAGLPVVGEIYHTQASAEPAVAVAPGHAECGVHLRRSLEAE